MEKYRPDIVVDVGPKLLDNVVEPLRSLLVGEVDPARQLIHQHPSPPSNVEDPDPDVFGLPGSGSISRRYGPFPFLVNALSGLK
jgi:hypothetical protein